MAGLAAITLVSGCNRSDDSRVEVKGSVSVNGNPLESGYLVLRPIAGGQTYGGTISDGRFLLPRRPGVVPAEYRVEFRAQRETGKTYLNSETGKREPVVEQFLPPSYNSKSEVIVTVSSSEPNDLTFNLEI